MGASDEVFSAIESQLTAEKAREIGATFLFDIGGAEGGKWFADFTRSQGPFIEKREGQAQCTIVVSNVDDWRALVSGALNSTMALMTGKVRVKGDMMLASKLTALLG